MNLTGPYDDEAAADADARTMLDLPRNGGHAMAANADRVLAICIALGVELGDYDRRIIAWLGGWEPATVQVIAGLIGRAHVAGLTAMSRHGSRAQLNDQDRRWREQGWREAGGSRAGWGLDETPPDVTDTIGALHLTTERMGPTVSEIVDRIVESADDDAHGRHAARELIHAQDALEEATRHLARAREAASKISR